MENAITLSNTRVEAVNPGRFVMDTTFVLFFLAMDIGASVGSFGLDVLLSAVTLIMFVVLPYFLPFSGKKPDFAGWAIGRVFIAILAILAGLAVQSAAGTVLPEGVRYVPMTLLIGSAILCAVIRIYAMLKVRLAV